MGIKRSTIANKWIPFILGSISIILTMLYLASQLTEFTWQTFLSLIFTGITQGIMLAGASVYVNQLIKQGRAVEDEDENTTDTLEQ